VLGEGGGDLASREAGPGPRDALLEVDVEATQVAKIHDEDTVP
jgi:hypothetical protein